ncbi:hypothetical protein GpartN1_g3036.t1 [Galdieria partita]|uniref:J domain-containing protein n=1 Tax=Galdieria partita TaxID=83374 RepID=A0A9C7UQ65_9RHOD|nr:hypothetical protein GpartN1_g3036.t1 [Galdieria partita]
MAWIVGIPIIQMTFTTTGSSSSSRFGWRKLTKRSHCYLCDKLSKTTKVVWSRKHNDFGKALRCYCRVEESYYRLLGVEPNADWDTIKRAYRKKALECHPDVCKDPNAKEKFVRILHAYQVLSKQKRSGTSRESKSPQSTKETHGDFMKEWRKKNPYPEDLDDDWASLWNDIVDMAKKTTESWKKSTLEETSGSFLEDILSFIQDQLVGLSSKEQEEDFEAVLRSGNPELVRKEIEHRESLLYQLQKKWEASEAVLKAKDRILEVLKQLYDNYIGQAHIQDELNRQINLAQSERDKLYVKISSIQQQRQREMDKVNRLKTQLDVDNELQKLKEEMGI